MNWPKIKNALFCRILVYVVVLGGFFIPLIVVACLGIASEMLLVILGLACVVGLLVYILKNIIVLIGLDIALAVLHCNNTARKQFDLPKYFSVKKTEKKIYGFGKDYTPVANYRQPSALRYKLCSPMTIYTRGIEKVIAAYHTEFLDREEYTAIFNSAKTNSNALIGKKKPLFLDKQQKRSPLNRVTVIFIFAESVDEKLRSNLYKTVCRQKGDGYDISFNPCVIDLERHTCVFNSERCPYTGYQYPVKNRGIRLIRNIIFNGSLPLKNNENKLDPIKNMDVEQSLWSFWRELKEKLE